jgi:hypothetical protein
MSAAGRTVPAMASRSNVSAGIITAQLDGRARYLLQHKVPRDEALEQLREIGATPEMVRDAADRARAWHERDPVTGWQSGGVADLLEALL